jgi:hypothetical protein
MLTDEGGRRSSSGGNQRGSARPDASRSSSVDRGIEGKEVGEEARCTGAGKRKTGETRDGVGRRPFMAARQCGREGKGQGGSGSVPRGGGRRSGEGGAEVWHRVSRHGTGAAALGGRTVNRGSGGRERRGRSG